MSTKQIDERVVSMKFDNQNFEKNVQTSMRTLDKLKEKLNFNGAVKGMEELVNSTDKLDFDALGNSISVVTHKFSALEIAGITAISRITDKVLDLGERLVKSLSVDQISKGWSKYEEKITAVQTIMSATASTWEENAKRIGFAGTQMEYVNEQLDKLNWFSDETSYSFTDMTSNIGKFTSSGVALDQAVTAMEGISVWAAKAGQNAQTATRAYYNLAQAISVGEVKLIDWKSIENANMATMEFKQTAIDTAEAMGTLKKVDEGVWQTLQGHEVTVRNFNEELKDGWFSSEVLLKTLDEYGKTTTRLSEISERYGITATEFLSAMDDYNEGNKSIDKIASKLGMDVETLIPLFTELSSAEHKLGLESFRAAQEAKTFTEAIEATKDAVSTQWMNTFELIFGNYEETKKLWSDMAEKLYDIFAGGGERRNDRLHKTLSNKWSLLTERINEAGISTEVFEKRLIATMENAGVPVQELLDQWGTLEEIFKQCGFLKKYIRETILSFTEPIISSAEGIQTTTEKLQDFQKVVNQVIRGEFGNGEKRVKALTDANYNYATVQGLVNKVWERNGHTWKDTTITMDDLVDVLGKMTDEELAALDISKEQVRALQELQEEARTSGTNLDLLINNIDKLSGRELIFKSISNVMDALQVAIEAVKIAWSEVFPEKATEELYGIIEGIEAFTEWLIMDDETMDKVIRTLKGLFSLIGIVTDAIQSIIKFLFPKLLPKMDEAGGSILSITANLGDGIVAIREFLQEFNLVTDGMDLLITIFYKAKEAFTEWIDAILRIPAVSSAVNKISNFFAKFVNFFKRILSEFYSDIMEKDISLGDALYNMFEKIKMGFNNFIDEIPLLKKAMNVIYNVADAMKSIGEYFGDGFFEGLKKTSVYVYDRIKDFVLNCMKIITDLLGIHSPSQWAIDQVWWVAKGIAEGIIEVTKFVIDKISNFVHKVLSSTKSEVSDNIELNPLKDIFKINETQLFGDKSFKEKLSDKFDNIIGVINKFLDKAKEGVGKFIDFVKKIPFGALYNIIKSILTIIGLINVNKFMNNVGKGIKNFGKGMKSIGNGIKNYLNGKSIKDVSKALLIFSVSVGIIIASIVALSKFSGPNLDAATKTVVTITIILSALFVLLSALDYAMRKLDSEDGGSSLKSIALLIASLGAAVLLIMLSVNKYFALTNSNGSDKVNAVIKQFGGVVLLLLGIVEGISLLNAKLNSGKNFKFQDLNMVWSILAIAISLKLILSTLVKTLFTKDKKTGTYTYNQTIADGLKNVFWTIAGIIVALSGSLALIGACTKGKNFKGIASSVLALSISMMIILKSISMVTNEVKGMMTYNGENASDIIKNIVSPILAVVTVIGIIVALAKTVSIIASGIKSKNVVDGFKIITVFIFVLSTFIWSMVGAIKMLETVPMGRLVVTTGSLIGSVFLIISTIAVLILMISSLWGANAKVGPKNAKDILGLLIGFVGVLGLFIIAIAGAIKIISDVKKPAAGIITILGSMVLVLGSISLLIFKANSIPESKIKTTIGTLLSIAALIGVVALALSGLTWATKGSEGTLIVAATVITVFVAVLSVLVNGLSAIQNVWGSVAVLVSIAVAIGAVALSLFELSKAPTDNLITVALVLGGVVVTMGAFIGILGSLASDPAIAGGIVVLDTIVGLFATLAFAIGYATDKIKDLLIVYGVMVYGREFAESLALIYSAQNGFIGIGNAAVTAGDNVSDFSSVVQNAMANTINPIDAVKQKLTEIENLKPTNFKEWVDLVTKTGSGLYSAAFPLPALVAKTEGKAIVDYYNKHSQENLDKYYEMSTNQEYAESGYSSRRNTALLQYRTRRPSSTQINSARQAEAERAGREDAIKKELLNDKKAELEAYEEEIKKWGTLNQRQQEAARQAEAERAGRQQAIEKEIELLDHYDLLYMETEDAKAAIDEYYEKMANTSEAGKQGAINFTNAFRDEMEIQSTEFSDDYVNMILKTLGFDGSGNMNVDLNEALGGQMIPFYDASGYDWTSFITSSGLANDNLQSITQNGIDVKNLDFASMMNALTSMQSDNNTNYSSILGYLQTLTNNSDGTINALNGMGVYLDKNTIVGAIAPSINQALGDISAGALRGQHH